MNRKKSQKGFALVSLLFSIVIITIIAVLLLKKSNDERNKSLPEIQEQAEQDVEEINVNLENYKQQIEIQNELNANQ